MAKKKRQALAQRPPESKVYAFRFSPRVTTDHFAKHKYTTPAKALRELVSNAWNAGATRVSVVLNENKMLGVDGVVVRDNGQGMTPDEIRDRFMMVGVEPVLESTVHYRGRFGVGRFAVHRIGNVSNWDTVAQTPAGKVRSRFTLDGTSSKRLKVEHLPVGSSTRVGTRIEISDLVSQQDLTPDIVRADFTHHFAALLLVAPNFQLSVQGEFIDISSLIEEQETQKVNSSVGEVTLHHLVLNEAAETMTFGGPIVFCSGGRAVTSLKPPFSVPNRYMLLVESEVVDDRVSENREALIKLDEAFTRLEGIVFHHTAQFVDRWKSAHAQHFLEGARLEPYYPFPKKANDTLEEVEREVFDVALEMLNRAVALEKMTPKQRQVIFQLLRRAVENRNVVDVLQEVAGLSDTDIESLKKLLERVTLQSIIRMATEVNARLEFVEGLHKLVYGEVADTLRERTQLHRILEQHCWLFGPSFHLACSDEGFRRVIQEHRRLAELPELDESQLETILNIDGIPDLFLTAMKDGTFDPRHLRLLVELKAPRVPVGRKEVTQLRRYAQVILDSDQLAKDSVLWNLIIVSSEINDEIQLDRSQPGSEYGFLWKLGKTGGPTVIGWAYTWADLIQRARDELTLTRQQLERKSQDLNLASYLRHHFPAIAVGIKGLEMPPP